MVHLAESLLQNLIDGSVQVVDAFWGLQLTTDWTFRPWFRGSRKPNSKNTQHGHFRLSLQSFQRRKKGALVVRGCAGLGGKCSVGGFGVSCGESGCPVMRKTNLLRVEDEVANDGLRFCL